MCAVGEKARKNGVANRVGLGSDGQKEPSMNREVVRVQTW
jgi:hypothetical protein